MNTCTVHYDTIATQSLTPATPLHDTCDSNEMALINTIGKWRNAECDAAYTSKIANQM